MTKQAAAPAAPEPTPPDELDELLGDGGSLDAEERAAFDASAAEDRAAPEDPEPRPEKAPDAAPEARATPPTPASETAASGGAPNAEEPDADSPAVAALRQELLELRRTADLERTQSERRTQGLLREVAKLRAQRQERDAGGGGAAQAGQPTDEELAVLALEFAEDGAAGVPVARIRELIAREMARAGASNPASAGPQSRPESPDATYQAYLEKRRADYFADLAARREAIAAAAPEAPAILAEVEQAERWLDGAITQEMERVGYENPTNDRGYMEHWLQATGLDARFRSLFPRAARLSAVELIEASASSDPAKVDRYFRRVVGLPEEGDLGGGKAPAAPSRAPAASGARRVAPHPSHASAGRAPGEGTQATREARYLELSERDVLDLSDAEVQELAKLHREFTGEGQGAPRSGSGGGASLLMQG